MDDSTFSSNQQAFPDAELLPASGTTCDCYRVKLYGKFHFMKRLKPAFRTDPRYVAALQKEFETGYRLEHAHLVRYVSRGEDYLLTEYVDGETLRDFSPNHPDYFKSKKNTDRLLSQLLDVVGYLHQHQIVHLDLKPENILITRIGHELKLADLGFCYTDTYSDTMGRTDCYAAPEQLHGPAKVDARTDIYAIGKVLQPLPCSHQYNKVIARCTAAAPSERYQTIEELQEALKPSSRRLAIALIVALLLIAIFLGSFFWQNPSAPAISSPEALDTSRLAAPTVDEDTFSVEPDAYMDVPNKPDAQANNSSSKTTRLAALEQLKADVAAAVLPKFNATMGALPDSVRPGTAAWAEAGRALEGALSNTLKELILTHQDFPMQTVSEEYNNYVQILITLKFNQNAASSH